MLSLGISGIHIQDFKPASQFSQSFSSCSSEKIYLISSFNCFIGIAFPLKFTYASSTRSAYGSNFCLLKLTISRTPSSAGRQ